MANGLRCRIGAFPVQSNEGANPYTVRFYGALAAHGISVVDDLVFSDEHLVENAERYDAIHLQWIEYLWPRRGDSVRRRLRAVAALWRYLRVARRLGKRVIVTMHNTQPHDSCDWIDRLGYRIVGRNSDLLICHSRTAAGIVQSRDRPRAKTVVMHHGSYDDSYPEARSPRAVREELGFDPDVPVVSCIGFLRDYKGSDLAVAGAERLHGTVQLLIAGAPWDGFGLADLEDSVRKTPGARLIPRRLTEQEFADYVCASDLLLLPYRRITGSGALLAAWSLGRSVVASDLPFFQEMLAVAGEGGALFRSGDVDDLANTIRSELSIPFDARRTAAMNAAKRFSWDCCVEPVVESIRGWRSPFESSMET